MKSIFQMLVSVTLAVVIGAGSAWAVGYERQRVRQAPFPKKVTKVHSSVEPRGIAREATLGQRVPAALDHAALTVRNLMSQFGLLDRKAP